MEKILNQILGELKGLNEGQGRLETRMDSIETKVDSLETKMDGFESRMDSFDTKMENLEKGQERLGSKVNTLDNKVEVLDSKVNTLDNKVEALDEKVDQLSLSIVNGLEPYFMNVEKHIDTTNEKVFSILQQQQNSIDIFSARSIHHEAEIKSINQLLRNQ